MIYAFVVDTSVSMNRAFSDLSYIDSAKAAVETFFKWESRKPESSHNVYVLVSYCKVVVPLTHNVSEMLVGVRGLVARDQSDAEGAFSSLFDYLSTHPNATKMDNPPFNKRSLPRPG
jgi:hypothetical protein